MDAIVDRDEQEVGGGGHRPELGAGIFIRIDRLRHREWLDSCEDCVKNANNGERGCDSHHGEGIVLLLLWLKFFQFVA